MLLATSTGSGSIRAWELQQQARAELTDRAWTWSDIATYPTLVYGMTRDLAKVGYLMLNEGEWNKVNLLPQSWIAQSTSPGLMTTPYYGFLWWLLQNPKGFYADGWLGQRLVVYPLWDLVAVRLHRTIGGDERENNLYSFKTFIEKLKASVRY